MNRIFRVLAIAGLLLVILPCVVMYGVDEAEPMLKLWMLVGTVLWFVFSYLGFRQNSQQRALEEEHTPVA